MKNKFTYLAGAALVVLGGLIITSRVWAANSSVSVSVCYITPQVSITSPTSGLQTTDSSVLVSGSADAGDTIYLKRNSVQVGQTTAANDGSFSLSAPLDLGANHLQATAQSSCGAQTDSNVVDVTRNQPPSAGGSSGGSSAPTSGQAATATNLGDLNDLGPTSQAAQNEAITSNSGRLVIISPPDHSVVSTSQILLTGEATAGATVYIATNNQTPSQVTAADDGSFQIAVSLQVGSNHIKAYTTSPKAEASITVERRASSMSGQHTSFLSRHWVRVALVVTAAGLLILVVLIFFSL